MARDIKINIGAKDLTKSVLGQVHKSFTKLGEKVKGISSSIATSTKGMASGFKASIFSVKTLVASLVALAGIAASIRFAFGSVEAFNVQAEAVRGLTLALELAGDAAAGTSEDLQQFAAGLQATLNVGDEVTLGLMKQASTMGVSSDALKDTAKAAIGLANATGISLEEALKKTVQAANGNAASLQELIPELMHATTESERLAIVQGVMAKGLADSEDQTDSLIGVMTRAENSFGDLRESIGAIVGPIKMVLAQGIAVFSETLGTLLGPAVERAKTAMQNMAPVFEKVRVVAASVAAVVKVALTAAWNVVSALGKAFAGLFGGVAGSAEGFKGVIKGIAQVVITAMTVIETAVLNMPKFWEMAKISTTIAVIAIIENIKHSFMVVIPTVLRNAGTAIVATFKWMWQAAKAVVVGYVTIIINVYKAAFNAIMTVVADLTSKMLTMLRNLMLKVAEVDPTGIAEKIAAGLDKASQNAKDNSKKFAEGYKNAGKEIVQAGKDMAKGMQFEPPEFEAIPARELLPEETDLKKRLGTIANDIADDYSTRLSARMGDLDTALAQEEPPKVDLDFDIGKIGSDISEEVKQVSALTATQGRLLSRGPSANPVLQENKKQTQSLEKIANNTDPRNASPTEASESTPIGITMVN